MKATYLAVAGRIRRDLQELNQVVERTQQIWQQGSTLTQALAETSYYVDAVALNLHGFYAGLERILEVIADGVDQSKPAGANWHRELIQQLTVEIRGIRPAVLSAATRDRLDRYRGFRHVVRHVYTFNLDPQQIELLIQHLPVTMAQVSQELMAFADVLEAIALAES